MRMNIMRDKYKKIKDLEMVNILMRILRFIMKGNGKMIYLMEKEN